MNSSSSSRIVLLTGRAGFLGKALHEILSDAGDSISSLGRSSLNEIQCDLGREVPTLADVPNLVVHAAGKAHSIPKTEAEAAAFYEVNHQGTQNLLKGLEQLPTFPQQFIFISTVAVYGMDTGGLIEEDSPLQGQTPYAKSKRLAEEVVLQWCAERGVNSIILRLPLIAGATPPGNLGKIIQAIRSGKYFQIRKNQAQKSIVLAEDIAKLLLTLEGKSGVYNLTDSQNPTFNDIEEAISKGLGKRIKIQLPLWLVKIFGKGGDLLQFIGISFPLTSMQVQKMTQSLTFSDQKAQDELGWKPRPVLEFLQQGLFLEK